MNVSLTEENTALLDRQNESIALQDENICKDRAELKCKASYG
jgi:hypothetical protein